MKKSTRKEGSRSGTADSFQNNNFNKLASNIDGSSNIIVYLSRRSLRIYQGLCNIVAQKVKKLIGVEYKFWVIGANWNKGIIKVQTNIKLSQSVLQMLETEFAKQGATVRVSIRPKAI